MIILANPVSVAETLGGRVVSDARRAELGLAFMGAPLEADGWDRALRLMAKHARSAHGQLIAIGSDNIVSFNHITDYDFERHRAFDAQRESYSSDNWRIGASRGPMEIVSERDYDAARALCRDDFYDDFVAGADIPFGCQTVLLQQPGLMLGLAALRNQRDGKTDEDDRNAFADAAPLALAAARMQLALDHQGAMMIAGAFEAMSAAAFLINGAGAVRAMTAPAEAAAAAGRLVTVSRGRLHARRGDIDQRLQAAIARGLDLETPAGPVGRFWLDDDHGAPAHRCEVFVLPRVEFSFGFAPRVLVTVREPLGLTDPEQQAIADLMGLTASEAAIAIALANGTDRESIAAARGSSPGTVGFQIKTLFRKADVTREGELVALINRLLR